MDASLTCGSDTIPVLLWPCSLMAPAAALHLPPLHAALAASAHSNAGGMSAEARAPRDEGCGPVPAAVRRALRGTTDFDDGCQGTGSLPALFVCLWPSHRKRESHPGGYAE